MPMSRRAVDEPRDLGVLLVVAYVLPIVGIVVAFLAGYPVPRWIVAATLSLCLVLAIVLGLRYARKPR